MFCGDLLATFQYLDRAEQECWREGLLATAWSDGERVSSFKMEGGGCRDGGKDLFTQRVVGHWSRLPRDIVGAFVLVMWNMSLPMAGRLGLDDL